MPAPRLDQVVTALVDALAQDHGTGLDLSAAGAVLRGRYPTPPRLPFAAVAGVEVRTERGPTLARWSSRCRVDVTAWGQVAGISLTERVAACEELADCITAAIQGAASSPGNALYGLPDLAFDGISMDSDLDGAAEVAAQVLLTVSWTMHRPTPGLQR